MRPVLWTDQTGPGPVTAVLRVQGAEGMKDGKCKEEWGKCREINRGGVHVLLSCTTQLRLQPLLKFCLSSPFWFQAAFSVSSGRWVSDSAQIHLHLQGQTVMGSNSNKPSKRLLKAEARENWKREEFNNSPPVFQGQCTLPKTWVKHKVYSEKRMDVSHDVTGWHCG